MNLHLRRWVRSRVHKARALYLTRPLTLPWYLAWDALDSHVNRCTCQVVHLNVCEPLR